MHSQTQRLTGIGAGWYVSTICGVVVDVTMSVVVGNAAHPNNVNAHKTHERERGIARVGNGVGAGVGHG
jgi:hypothetical protein